MTKIPREAGLRSDGELVQGGADTFVFAPTREDAVGLLLPAVQAFALVPGGMPETAGAHGDWDAHGDWIEILTMSPPPPTRATQSGGDDDDDDGLPPTVVWDLGNAGGYDDGLPPTLDWDLG